jgi:hypothetical protein
MFRHDITIDLREMCSIKVRDKLVLWMDVLCLVSGCVVFTTHHDTRHNTPLYNILSIEHIFPKALGTLPEDGNIMPKHVEATTHN